MSDRTNAGDRGFTESLSRPTDEQPLAVVVRVVTGKALPERLRFTGGTCRVGAEAHNEIVVDDKAVSRAHLELQLVPEGVRVVDLGSRNGTFYLGQRVSDITLAPGSRITLGSTELLIEADREELEQTSAEGPSRYGALVGTSPAMRRLFNLMTRLEGSLVNVLIEGESGTGKELVARALHDHSAVAGGPFVAINCGALDRALARSELFGHKKGAFTGAAADAVGAFQSAHGGTLFLDEIGELAADVQPVLLRALETGRVARVGETSEQPVKVRLVAATNRTLKDAVDQGSFRSDLYYRLVVVRLAIPPLRERPSDIVPLAQHLAAQVGLGPLPPELVRELSERTWPGNVRELKNALLGYAAVGELDASSARETRGGELEEALRRTLDLERPYADQKEALIETMTRLYLTMLLEHTKGNRSEAARISGLQRGYLRRLLEKLGVGE
jgi:DNA-binding NtrC family response regulator